MTFTIDQARKSLITQEMSEQLNAEAEWDNAPDTHAPANWIITAVDDEDGHGVAVVAIGESLTTPELAQTFGDLAGEKGATHGHGLNPITGDTIFFGQTIEQITAYANAYAEYKRQQKRGKGKGFG